jgi:hypothetical protein
MLRWTLQQMKQNLDAGVTATDAPTSTKSGNGAKQRAA